MAGKRPSRHRMLVVFGTRPEALKLAPLLLAARRRKRFLTKTCLTAQHREMVDPVLDLFGIRADFDLDVMRPNQGLGDLTRRLLPRLEGVLRRVRPSVLVVQGDTTSAFAVALTGFHEGIQVAHVEAGLRSGDRHSPFPEEVNRVMISRLADVHFAPTETARRNLLREGIPSDRIFVTGNTVVDGLRLARRRLRASRPAVADRLDPGKRLLLVTAHRRESFGRPIRSICSALRGIVRDHPDIEIVFPVHPNPRVNQTIRRSLGGTPGIHLIPPLPYPAFLALVERSYLLLTDSGGIQEEAPSFHKPVLVLREVTERREGERLGLARVVGTDAARIRREAGRLLTDRRAYERMIGNGNPYGDGRAAGRILGILDRLLRRRGGIR